MRAEATNPWRLLGLATLVQMGVSVVDQGLPTLNGFIKAELGVSAAVAGLAVSSFAFGKIFGSYAAGLAADRLGERRVIVTGAITVGTLAAIAAALPDSLIFVVLFVAGLAASTSTPAGGRLVLMAFPRERHGIALSLRQCGIPAGGLVAAALLPWLAHMWSWRWSLAVAGAITVTTALPLVVHPVEQHDEMEAHASVGTVSPARDRNIRLLTIWGCLVVTGQYTILAFLALDLHQRAGPLARLGLAARLACERDGHRRAHRLGRDLGPRALARAQAALARAERLRADGGGAAAGDPERRARRCLHRARGDRRVRVDRLPGALDHAARRDGRTAARRRSDRLRGHVHADGDLADAAVFGLVADTAGTYRAVWARSSASCWSR